MQDTVMLGADYYETDIEVASLLAEGRVPIGIGENTKIRYTYFTINELLKPHGFFYLWSDVNIVDPFVCLQELYNW